MHTQRGGEGRVDLGELRFVHRLHGRFEGRGLAGQFLGEIVGGEGHVEGPGLVRLHAGKAALEIRQGAALAEDHRKVPGLAAGKGLVVDPALVIQMHTVTGARLALDGQVVDTLFFQHLQGPVDIAVTDFDDRAGHLDLRQVADLDVGEDLEGGDEGALFVRAELRIAGDRQLVFLHRTAKRLLQGLAQHLAANLATVAGRHQLDRRLADTETVDAHGPGDLLQALAHLGLDQGRIQVQRHAS